MRCINYGLRRLVTFAVGGAVILAFTLSLRGLFETQAQFEPCAVDTPVPTSEGTPTPTPSMGISPLPMPTP